MEFDVRRCAEAAVHAALAEAFTRPDPKRVSRGRKRRRRPIRATLRLVRLTLMGVGLVTTVRMAIDADLRRDTLESLASRFPIEDLLEEIAVELDAARTALANATAEEAATTSEDEREAATEKPGQRRRRTSTRTRGDTNGQRGRKPPNRGTRAA